MYYADKDDMELFKVHFFLLIPQALGKNALPPAGESGSGPCANKGILYPEAQTWANSQHNLWNMILCFKKHVTREHSSDARERTQL